MKNIPSVDLNDFLSNDIDKKKAFVNKLGKAYNEIGFVALKGHFLTIMILKKFTPPLKNFLIYLRK